MRTRLGLGGQVVPGRRGVKEHAGKRPACQTTCEDVTDLLQSWPGSGTPAKRTRTLAPVVDSPGFKIYEDYLEIKAIGTNTPPPPLPPRNPYGPPPVVDRVMRLGEGRVVLRREEILRELNIMRMQRRGSMMNRRGSVMESRGSVIKSRGSLMERKGSVMEGRGSLIERRGSLMESRGSMMESRGSVMERKGSMMKRKGSVMERTGSVMERKGSLMERVREKESWDQRTVKSLEDGKIERLGSISRMMRLGSMKRVSFDNTPWASLSTESLDRQSLQPLDRLNVDRLRMERPTMERLKMERLDKDRLKMDKMERLKFDRLKMERLKMESALRDFDSNLLQLQGQITAKRRRSLAPLHAPRVA